jgi:hypothetical protein
MTLSLTKPEQLQTKVTLFQVEILATQLTLCSLLLLKDTNKIAGVLSLLIPTLLKMFRHIL